MARRKTRTPSHVVEMPLSVTIRDDREARIRLELGRRMYNGCLGEALRRLHGMRESVEWQRTRALPTSGKKKDRTEAFKRIAEKHGFTCAAISAYGTTLKNDAKWNVGRKRTDPRLGAHEGQRIAERAFAAVFAYSIGKRGRPRFKGKSRPLHALEGKSMGSGLAWDAGTGCLRWGDLALRALMPPDGKDAWLSEALKARTKYARIVWRTIGGRRRWFVQLVQEGIAPSRRIATDGVVGIDVGPSTIAVYSEKAAALVPLAAEIDQPWKAIRTLQRAMERSRRATNPDCYHGDGTWRRGARVTVRSAGYQALRGELAETARKLAAARKRSHGQLVNRILGLGTTIKAETLSYRALQKNYGRSIQVHGTGMLMQQLRRKAESAGGEMIDLHTWRLRLSQFDHVTRAYVKKPLRQRWHTLGNGSGVVQRDLYSAFLAAVADRETLNPSRADDAWPVAQSLLGRAGWMREQPASVASVLVTAPGLPMPERVVRQRTFVRWDSRDAVAATREPGKPPKSGFRTPLL